MAAGRRLKEPFVYGTLDITSKQIRIIRLEPQITLQDIPKCRLRTLSLKDKPEYTALSYSWGDARDKYPILVDNRTLLVTQNLLHFLRQAACELHDGRSTTNAYWIDAICINQEDESEKSSQVAMMGDIYAKAMKMDIWLGPASHDSLHAIEFLKELASAQSSVDSKRSGLLQTRVAFSVVWWLREICKRKETTVTSLANLASRSWWSRIWIQQEVTLAKFRCSRLKCGEDHVSWRKVVLAHDAIHSILQHTEETLWHLTGSAPENISSVLSGLTGSFARMQQTCMNSYPKLFGDDKGRKQSLANRLVTNAEALDHRLNATDSKDYVYGLLAICPDARMKPDYSVSKEALYTEVSQYLLKTIGSYTFSMCARKATSSTCLPSWVPDLSTTTRRQSLSRKPRAKGLLDKAFEAVFKEDLPFQVFGSQLHLSAKRVDKIAGCHQLETVSARQTHPDERAGDLLQAWLLSYDRFLNGGRGAQSVSESRPDLADVWWRIPICDDRAPIMFRGTWYKNERRCFDKLMTQARTSRADVEIGWETIQYRDRMMRCVIDRSPFMSASGSPGLGPRDIVVEDEIFVVRGSEWPLIFRPMSDGTYRLVGEAYVHGLNCAKALKQEPPAEIIIVV